MKIEGVGEGDREVGEGDREVGDKAEQEKEQTDTKVLCSFTTLIRLYIYMFAPLLVYPSTRLLNYSVTRLVSKARSIAQISPARF